MTTEAPAISKEGVLAGLNEALLQVETPDQAFDGIVTYFHALQEANPDLHIGLISGRVTGCDEDAVASNKERLVMYSDAIGVQKEGAVIFSCPEAFTPETKTKVYYDRMEDNKKRIFWKRLVEAGIFTDIYMTPDWEKSSGAWMEYQTARRRRDVAIHFIIDTENDDHQHEIQYT